jgi:hypothetical protein
MKNRIVTFSIFVLLLFASANIVFAQDVKLGPRVTGNFNIYNEKGLTGTWNGIGVGIGGTIDVSFNKHIGIMGNLTFFDMRSFSFSQSQQNVNTDVSLSLSYLTLEPMFKLEFSGFYMVAGPSFGIKLGSSGEITQSQAGQTPQVQTINPETKSIRFDIATGVGYTFKLSSDMSMGTDFIANIPITDTYNKPGLSNSVFTLKLGVSLKFNI